MGDRLWRHRPWDAFAKVGPTPIDHIGEVDLDTDQRDISIVISDELAFLLPQPPQHGSKV
ncbi:hypothetical protein GCM10009744_65020 [Kribbella alba]|uniref:Uncharacterized protein n=1 Tax=Kribbella alba TaxID=190197 RepID=A0ABN2FZ14_9ACTN